uniref:GDSL-type esterase/lipase family protein n=1 Tax=Clostridium sp. TaxID=1506 RepID=UPI0025BD5E6F
GGSTSGVSSILQNMKWCVIGDSISDVGVGRTNKWYQEFIADRVGCTLVDWNGDGTGYIKSFNRQEGLINRINEIPEDSNVITIFLGTNDNAALGTLGTTDTTTFYGAVEYCIKTIKEKYPLIPLGVMTPLPCASKNNLSYSKAIKEVCEKYYVPVLDLNKICNINLSSPLYKLNYMPDGLHPNDNLHRDISYRVQAWLENEVLVCNFTDNIIQRGLVVFPQNNLTYTSGSTLDLQVALSHVPNERQGVKLTCGTSGVTFSEYTLYFDHNKDVQTVTLTIPASVSGNLTITGTTWGVATTTTISKVGGSESVAVESISLNKSSHTMKVDETVQLTATINPSTATNQNITWSTNNSNCTVQNGLVTGVTEGECIITATSEDGGHTASCTITVQAKTSDVPSGTFEYYVNLDFNDNSNLTTIKNLADSSKNGSVNQTSLVSWANGVMDINCTGSNQGIDISNYSETFGEISVEFTYQPNEAKNSTLFYITGLAGDNLNLTTKADLSLNVGFKSYDDGTATWQKPPTINATLPTESMTHIILSIKSGEFNVYINGELSVSAANTFTNLSMSKVQLMNYNVNGKIDTFRIYKSALTSTQAVGLYNSYINKSSSYSIDDFTQINGTYKYDNQSLVPLTVDDSVWMGVRLTNVENGSYSITMPNEQKILGQLIWYMYKYDSDYMYVLCLGTGNGEEGKQYKLSTKNKSVSQIGTLTIPYTLQTNEEMRIVVNGSTQTLYHNDTLLATLNDCNTIGACNQANDGISYELFSKLVFIGTN